ncbi:hypothetical protein [Streptomyces hydrogenans]|uniref:hypothetical protein n=1 Tax=Streptomyces hydrogenans TaxID=1873719 RepID=UPI0035D94659
MSQTTPAQSQENEATETYGVAQLAGIDLRVKPGGQWRPSYLRALREGDYDTWAAGVLHAEDVQTFVDADATFDEINSFVTDAMASTGETPGKSGGSSGSSTRTRKR